MLEAQNTAFGMCTHDEALVQNSSPAWQRGTCSYVSLEQEGEVWKCLILRVMWHTVLKDESVLWCVSSPQDKNHRLWIRFPTCKNLVLGFSSLPNFWTNTQKVWLCLGCCLQGKPLFFFFYDASSSDRWEVVNCIDALFALSWIQ